MAGSSGACTADVSLVQHALKALPLGASVQLLTRGAAHCAAGEGPAPGVSLPCTMFFTEGIKVNAWVPALPF